MKKLHALVPPEKVAKVRAAIATGAPLVENMRGSRHGTQDPVTAVTASQVPFGTQDKKLIPEPPGRRTQLPDHIEQEKNHTRLDTSGPVGTPSRAIDIDLWVRCRDGRSLDTINQRLKEGADINHHDMFENGDTPLMIATRNRHREIVEFLLSKGADSRAVNLLGKTALDITFDIATAEDGKPANDPTSIEPVLSILHEHERKLRAAELSNKPHTP